MDPTRLFKSKTRKELLRLFFTNPDSEYYLRELEKMLNIPVSMIRKELIQLEKEGIFTTFERGNQSYYKLNKTYPLFNEFKSIVSKTIGVQGLLAETLKKIKGIDIAFIYGSFAKNEEKAQSDIDLFVIGNVIEDKLIGEIRKLENTLLREINYCLYTKEDLKKKKSKKDSFIMDLLENKKIFLIGEANDL